MVRIIFLCVFQKKYEGSYFFWSGYVPLLRRFDSAKETVKKLAEVTGEDARNKIVSAYRAIEGFVTLSCVALGILQLCALRFTKELQNFPWRWLRTYSSPVPSEATVADCLRRSFPAISRESQNIDFLEIIQSKRTPEGQLFYDTLSLTG